MLFVGQSVCIFPEQLDILLAKPLNGPIYGLFVPFGFTEWNLYGAIGIMLFRPFRVRVNQKRLASATSVSLRGKFFVFIPKGQAYNLGPLAFNSVDKVACRGHCDFKRNRTERFSFGDFFPECFRQVLVKDHPDVGDVLFDVLYIHDYWFEKLTNAGPLAGGRLFAQHYWHEQNKIFTKYGPLSSDDYSPARFPDGNIHRLGFVKRGKGL